MHSTVLTDCRAGSVPLHAQHAAERRRVARSGSPKANRRSQTGRRLRRHLPNQADEVGGYACLATSDLSDRLDEMNSTRVVAWPSEARGTGGVKGLPPGHMDASRPVLGTSPYFAQHGEFLKYASNASLRPARRGCPVAQLTAGVYSRLPESPAKRSATPCLKTTTSSSQSNRSLR